MKINSVEQRISVLIAYDKDIYGFVKLLFHTYVYMYVYVNYIQAQVLGCDENYFYTESWSKV